MKYTLIKNWGRHVKDTKCSHVRHETACRSAVEAYCLSPGTPFSLNETTTYNRLQNGY
jgi:hypothetical protein